MNKSAKKISSLLLGVLMAGSVVGSSGIFTVSAKAAGGRDPEKDAVVFATDALDGNFNPFFATSGTDTTIIAQTQIGMLTTDEKGNAVCGEDYPTVVLDYKETMVEGEWNPETQKIDNAKATSDGAKADYTQYDFIIKNGIKFSDGKELTIKDVLFNLYVYLDPVYMGSATIYSTDIVGLQAYRSQDPLADDNVSDQTFYIEAQKRVQAIMDCLDPDSDTYGEYTDQITADIEKTRTLFQEEVTSDWNANVGTLESYEKEYNFTEDWQLFYFLEGIVTVKREINANGVNAPVKDENGKYVTSLDDENNILAEEIENQRNDSAKIAEYMKTYKCDEAQAKEYIVRDFAIKTVYETYSDESKLPEVLAYWATGSNILDEFAAEAKTKFYDGLKGEDGELRVKSVSGITTSQTTKDYDGKNLGETHDVLSIVINKVDPKAIWNFSFTVAPMHYYSNEEETAKANKGEGFGVKFADKKFFDEVLKDTEKSGLPVGAGVYMAADQKGNKTSDRTEFYLNNNVYFTRNDYFETVGSGLCNAKIKRMTYTVVASNQIINALATGRIDFGSPNATEANIKELAKYKELANKQYWTNGYGYVGVNPKFVPDIEVRRAIMKAMDTASIIRNYYTESLADVIYRPMSNISWAYPEDATEYDKIAFTTEKEEIEALVESAGWTKSGGVYQKNGKTLKLTFTIAGDTTDHPAYSMFEEAATFLRECGFDITVTTSINALKSLATGALEVWAAAWSSTIDPDMYQVYHKDSTATSTKNWGYQTIFADTTGQFDEEQEIINELSDLIEQGRQTINQADRKAIYGKALDKVMELAVELPTYQRKDLVVYNKNVIDSKTLNQNPSATSGVYDRLWEVNYVTGDGAAAGGNGGSVGLIIGIVAGVAVIAAAAVVVLKLRKKPEIVIEETEENVEATNEESVEETNETVDESVTEDTVETTEEAVAPAEETNEENE